jgi:hypothetical protein
MDLLTEDYQQLLSKIDEILRCDFKLGIELIKSQNIDITDVAEFVYNIENSNYGWFGRSQSDTRFFMRGFRRLIYEYLWKYNHNAYNIDWDCRRYFMNFATENPSCKLKTLIHILKYSINE